MTRAVGAVGGRVRRRNAPAREKAIRAAALRVFRRKGYHAATMRDIADVVGIDKGSLYYYISSKDQLLTSLFEGLADQVLLRLREAASAEGTATERLRAMVRVYVVGLLEHLEAVRVYLREEPVLPPRVFQQVRAQRQAMRVLFEQVIAEGTRAREFVAGDVKISALAILGMCTWIHRWYTPRGRLSETELAHDLAERSLRMLRP